MANIHVKTRSVLVTVTITSFPAPDGADPYGNATDGWTHRSSSKISARRIAVLLLFVCGILNAAESTGQNYFNVRNCGAVGDGKHLDRPAIKKAIDAAVAVGGGTVFVPAGTYLSGSIRPKSNHQRLDAGAMILADKWNSEAFDPTETYTLGAYRDGGHSYCHDHSQLIGT